MEGSTSWSEWWDVIHPSQRDISGTADFWDAYLVAGFQGPEGADGDNENASESGGSNDGADAGAIWVEPLREEELAVYSSNDAEHHTVTHEIGHQGGGKHGHDGLMTKGAPIESNTFEAVTIKIFRKNSEF